MYACMYVRMYVRMYVCMYVRMYVRVYVRMYVKCMLYRGRARPYTPPKCLRICKDTLCELISYYAKIIKERA